MRSFLSVAAIGAAILTATSAPAFAEPVAYTFDKTHTSITASWSHLGYSTQTIQFTDYDGTLLLDLEDPSASTVEVEFSLENGFWVGPGQDQFVAHLNSAEIFNIEAFPTATFVATGFETEDGTTGTLTGDLTLLDKTVPVTLDVTLNQAAPNPMSGTPTAGFTATGTITRSDFGLGYAAPYVSDEVAVVINTELQQVAAE